MGNKSASKKLSKAEQDKLDNITSIIFIAAVVICVLGVILYNAGVFEALTQKGNVRVDMQTGKVVKEIREFPDAKPSESVDIPGYKLIEFKANKLQQKTYLGNPASNKSYFKLSLILEDGTVIWQSDYLEPGVAFSHIELNQKLEKGTYENATLHYDTYSVAGYKQENSSDIKLTIGVK